MAQPTPSYLSDRTPGAGALPARSWLHSDASRLDLTGEWAFRLLPTAEPEGEAADAFAQPGADVTSWARIPVPASWVLQEDGRWGRPIYTNVQFPFPVDPPRVPDENPTGDYRRVVDVPDDLATDARLVLRFDGVESTFRVWWNGVEVGIGKGSRLAHEFDVTDLAHGGENVLAVRVHQWSDASYLEDQDQWWLPGIFRDVSLTARPAAGIRDVWLRTSWRDGVAGIDPEIDASPAAFPVRLQVAELGIDVTWPDADAVAPLVVPDAAPWSAESPRLYDATVSSSAEEVRLCLGFRSIEIVGDVLLANGRRLVFHGMNRHEAHPDRGRVFDEEHARADLARMKRHNVNAIRTSHYPPHPRLLDLADELGLWVVLECDLETHGFQAGGWDNDATNDSDALLARAERLIDRDAGHANLGAGAWTENPSDDPAWRPAYLDRIIRTVERDKNHASVVVWSLGNESGTGANLAAMAAWVHERDPERPVHYEGDYTGAYTDIYSRMYSSVPETRSIGSDDTSLLLGCSAAESARQRSKPFLLCEYVHAMGNGPGAIDQYEELVERYPRLHGGFVWEWRDHGIRSTAPDGSEFFAYGGDFGEVVHDGNFVMDGMILSNDVPTPGLAEYAAVMAPFRVSREGDAFTIRSMRHSADAADVRFVWRVEHDGEELDGGELDVPALAAGETVSLALPAIATVDTGETWLTVEARLRDDSAWADAGHVLGTTQFDLTPAAATAAARARSVRWADAETGAPARLVVGPAVFEAGRLTELAGSPVSGPLLSLYRAPTDNDSLASRGSYDLGDPNAAMGNGVVAPPLSEDWERAGLDRLTARIEELESTADGIRVLTRHAPAASRLCVWTDIRWQTLDENTALLSVDILPSAGWDMVWPRLGIRFDLPGTVASATWFGTGPLESYPDSLRAARVGRFTSSVDDLSVDYARPQETGHRSALRSLELAETGGAWLRLDAEPDARGRRPGFTLSRHTAEEIAAAAHPFELPASGSTHLYLDAAQHGLGSRACGVDVWPSAILRPEARSLRLRVSTMR